MDTRGKFPFPKAAGPSRPQCILCRDSKWNCRRPETALEGPFSGTGPCSQLGCIWDKRDYAVPRGGSRSLQRGGKAIPLKAVGLGHSFLCSPKKLSPALLPSPQAQDWGSPGGTRGPQGHTGRLCLKAAERIARVTTVAGVWTRTFFRPPHELRHSRCPTTPARKPGAPRYWRSGSTAGGAGPRARHSFPEPRAARGAETAR